MSSIHPLIFACAWALLAATPARADDPRGATTDERAAHLEHSARLMPVPECPHCRKAALLAKTSVTAKGTATSTAAPENGVSAAAGSAPRDPNVKPAQLPATPDVAGPTPAVPATETRDPGPPDTAPLPAPPAPVLSQMPQAVPDSSLPSSDSASRIAGLETLMSPGAIVPAADEDQEPELPDLPDDLKDAAASEPKPAGDSDRRMPAPVFLPAGERLESLLAEPPIEAAPLISRTTAPDQAVSSSLDTSAAPAIASRAGEGPSARILTPAPTGPALAMPPPAAGPLEDDGNAHSHLNGFSYLPVMIGDQSPASMLTALAPFRQPMVPGQPPTPPSPFARTARQPVALIPWARGFKIADNQSPMPQDRVFYTFDYFNNMNGDVNRRLGSAITDMQAYRQLLGIEKTFWRGNASIGVRLPIDTLWTNSGNPSLRGNSTSVGNVSVFTKFLLYDNPALGSMLSGGLAVTAPTGPSSFAGSRGSLGIRDTQIQPFLGYILRRGDFYLQGFSAIDVPTDSRDVTMWYNDLALGYFVYQSADPSAFLSAVVPTFEVHLNDPLNHRGTLRPNDPAGTPDVLDLTFGTSFIIHKRLVATVGCAFPVTGPRPFDIEALALLNFYYGRYGMAQPWPMPPVSR